MEPIDYQLHYSSWHREDTREKDIESYISFLKLHRCLPEKKDAPILELGCGMGNLLLALKRLGYVNVKGVDVDSGQINSCKKHGLNVEKTDALSYLSSVNDTFDTVFAFDIFEHMPKENQLKLGRSIFEKLNTNGTLFLTVPNSLSPLGHFFESIDWTHYNTFSPHSLSFLLKNSSFNHFTFRPTHFESEKVLKLKETWVALYQEEFNIKDPILTPSLLAACFKSEDVFDDYNLKVTKISNAIPKRNFLKSLKTWILKRSSF